MDEKPLPLSEEYGPIQRLFEHECTSAVVLTRQKSGKTIDNAAFTFFKIGRYWFRIFLSNQVISCRLDDLYSPKYGLIEDGYSYKRTDLSPLILADTARITDVYLTQGFNYTKSVFNFTHSRSLQLRYYQDSGRTLLSII